MTAEITGPLSLDSVTKKTVEIAQQPGAGALVADLKDEEEVVVATFQKSGWKSSEFWLTLLITLAGTGFAAVQIYQGKLDAAGAATFLGAVLKATSYTRGRAALKEAAATAATP